MNTDAIFERLNRTVANPPWINFYKDARVENLPLVGSDHGPILLSMSKSLESNRFPPFRFEVKLVVK